MDQAERLRRVIRQQKQQKQTENKQPAKVVTITSGKGGVGKTNLAVNFAVHLRKMGKQVIIFDADLGLANVEVMFGSAPQFNLRDLIYNGKDIKEIITWGPFDIGFISGGSGIANLNNLTKEQIVYLVHCLSELNDMADVIIVDTGAGISDTVLEFVIASPEVFLVTTPEPSSLTDAYSLLKAVYRNPVFSKEQVKIHIVANKVHSMEEGRAVFSKLNSVVTQFLKGQIDLFGIIPQDRELELAVRSQKIVSVERPNAKSSRAFEGLANQFIAAGEQQQNAGHKGITQFFLNFLSRKRN